MDDLRALSAHNEEEMKMELNEMEKQLHKAICQSVELEKKLTEILAEKTTLLEKVSIDAESKSVEVENLKTQLSVISDLERKHQEIIQSDRKKFDEKFLILRDNDRRSKSRIRQLEEELDEKVENLKKFDEMDEMLSLANEKVEHLNAILKNVEKCDVGIQYDGINVTQVITEEITETVQRRIPTRYIFHVFQHFSKNGTKIIIRIFSMLRRIFFSNFIYFFEYKARVYIKFTLICIGLHWM